MIREILQYIGNANAEKEVITLRDLYSEMGSLRQDEIRRTVRQLEARELIEFTDTFGIRMTAAGLEYYAKTENEPTK